MDYNELFEKKPNAKFFYSDYPGTKLVVGSVNLENAINRMHNFSEYYTLVTYNDGEELPKQYVPCVGLETIEGVKFATINEDPRVVRVSNICQNGGIQLVSRFDMGNERPKYLLGPGPETVELDDLIIEQYQLWLQKNRPDLASKGHGGR